MPSAVASAARNAGSCPGARGSATVTSCSACRRASWSGGSARKTKTFLRAVRAVIVLKSFLLEFCTGRQAFAVAQHLHGACANPGAAPDRVRHAQAVEQRTDHADGKAVSGAHGIDD